jgi:release factor glutamine methyltransferase
MRTIAQTLRQNRERLSRLPDNDPRLEAEILLASVLEKPRTYLLAWPERELTADQQARLDDLIERRLRGEPVAYLTGRREFWSLDLTVTPATLIPRPETELLVELALELIPADAGWRIADLGTGSGAIAAAIAAARPGCSITATDTSAEALAVAENNFRKLGFANITTACGIWYTALAKEERFDLLVSNPPYVAEDDPHLQQGDLPHEPRAALAAGPDGLNDLRQIIAEAPRHLTPGGWLLLEHGFEQGAEVRRLLQAAGFTEITTHRDLAGLERVSAGRFTS